MAVYYWTESDSKFVWENTPSKRYYLIPVNLTYECVQYQNDPASFAPDTVQVFPSRFFRLICDELVVLAKYIYGLP